MDTVREQRINALKELLTKNSRDIFALYGLALEYKALDDRNAAVQLLRQVIEHDPDHLYAYYQLGEILHSLGDDDDAMAALEIGLKHARRAGESKAAHELQALLDII